MERLTIRLNEATTRCAFVSTDNCFDHANCFDCPKYKAIVEKLAHYEDLEEAGRLVVRPCAVGDTVYQIRVSYDLLRRGKAKHHEHEVKSHFEAFMYNHNAKFFVAEKKCGKTDLPFIGKSVFLTREEAENKIKEVTA